MASNVKCDQVRFDCTSRRWYILAVMMARQLSNAGPSHLPTQTRRRTRSPTRPWIYHWPDIAAMRRQRIRKPSGNNNSSYPRRIEQRAVWKMAVKVLPG